jgi:hypothetical protein
LSEQEPPQRLTNRQRAQMRRAERAAVLKASAEAASRPEAIRINAHLAATAAANKDLAHRDLTTAPITAGTLPPRGAPDPAAGWLDSDFEKHGVDAQVVALKDDPRFRSRLYHADAISEAKARTAEERRRAKRDAFAAGRNYQPAKLAA